MKKILLLILLLSGYIFSSAQITLTTFATGLSAPIDVVNAGDKRLFVVQQSGVIVILDTTGAVISNFIDLSASIVYGGEQGLLGLAFDPNYTTNGFFYVDYTATGTGETHISRFKVSANPDVADAASERILLRIYQPQGNHNGGNLIFRPLDHYLYIGMGDGGAGGDTGAGHDSLYGNAQSKDSLLGKILRIDVSDTSVAYRNPPTNPFYSGGGRGEIWDYGVRNPWRWSFDRWNGDFWIGDVGQNAYEEIDYEPASSAGGVNYGWRCYEANHVYNPTNCGPVSNYTFPILEVPHTLSVCAIIGGYMYRGAEFSNLWGKYFYSDECTSAIGVRSITHVGSNFYDSAAVTHGGTFVSMGEDKYGEMYIADYGGTIYKFQGASCSPNAIIHYTDTVLNCYGTPLNFYTPNGRGFHYQWTMNSNPIGIDSSGLSVTAAGDYAVTATDRNGCTAVATTIHVTNAVPPVVSITGADTMYCVYDTAVTFTGNPAGGTFSGLGMTGNSFNPSTAGIGYDTITYAYTNITTGCSNSISSVIHVDACLGIGENPSIVSLSLYPNPNSGSFTLKLVARNGQIFKAEVLDILGKLVSEKEISVSTGTNTILLDNNLAKGVYTLKLSNENATTLRSFIVN